MNLNIDYEKTGNDIKEHVSRKIKSLNDEDKAKIALMKTLLKKSDTNIDAEQYLKLFKSNGQGMSSYSSVAAMRLTVDDEDGTGLNVKSNIDALCQRITSIRTEVEQLTRVFNNVDGNRKFLLSYSEIAYLGY